jgi:hypothetical protein
MKTMPIIIALVLSRSVAFAQIFEMGTGMLFGEDHTFKVTACPGWVLDNKSGVGQGLHMLFYPKGETYGDSPVIVYGRSVPKNQVPTIKSQVDNTIRDFHKNGSPDYRGEKQPFINLTNGDPVEVYHFSGDQWGNYEAAAYYDEEDTINYLVFNARTKESFDKYIDDFYEIASSYRNIYRPLRSLKNVEIDVLISQTKKQLESPGAKEYEAYAAKAVGQNMANIMRACTTYSPQKEPTSFHMFIRINGNGTISESVVYPKNRLTSCFRGFMWEVKFPRHIYDSFLFDINMKVKK